MKLGKELLRVVHRIVDGPRSVLVGYFCRFLGSGFSKITRSGNPWALYNILLVATACVVGLGIASAQDRLFGNKTALTISHEKDLLKDNTGVEIGVFKWSPDSRRIAYVKWNLGQIGIVDVDTGKAIGIPNFYLSGISTLAWSDDGLFLAVASVYELKIIRLSDFKITHTFDLQGKAAYARLRFGDTMAFSHDGTKLVFENRVGGFSNENDSPAIILATYDLVSETIEPTIRSPYVTRHALPLPDSGRFQWHGAHLYYSVLIMRYDEGKAQKKIIGQVDYGVWLLPSTCFVFDLGDGSAVASTRSLDFPASGQEVDDGSEDIKFCQYSSAVGAVVVRRRNPANYEEEKPPYPKSDLTYFEAFRLDGFATLGRYPPLDQEQKLVGPYYGLHPAQPWAVTLTASPKQEPLLTVWDFTSGKEIAHEQLGTAFLSAEISPDGSRIAFVSWLGNPQILIYKFNIH